MEKDPLQVFLEQYKDEGMMTEKQIRILEAAIKLFSEKGFHASSTAEIAKEAGVAEGTIFRHFKTKKDILLALIAPLAIRIASPFILKDVREIMSFTDKTVDEIAKLIFKNRLQLVQKHWDRIKIIIQEVQFHPEIQEAIVDNLAKRGRELAETFIKKRMEAGEIRELPPTVIARTFFSMMVGYILFKHMFSEESLKLDDEQEIELMVDILMNGVKKNKTQL